jgi:opacity protein-like surface antigen
MNSFSMKFKESIGVILFFFLVTPGSAQIVYSNKESSRFSFTAGMTSTKLLHDTVSYRPGIGFGGGFRYSIVLNNKLNVGLEAMYTGKSFKTESSTIKYRFFYIDLPLYLQYKLGESIRFNFGGQVSTYTNSKVVVLDGTNKNGVNVQNSTGIKAIDYSVLAGAEFDLTDDIAFGFRYNLSTSTFLAHDKPNFSVFEVSLNYVVYRSYRHLGKSPE